MYFNYSVQKLVVVIPEKPTTIPNEPFTITLLSGVTFIEKAVI